MQLSLAKDDVMNLRNLVLLAFLAPAPLCTQGCAPAPDTATADQAVTGDFANMASRYGWGGITGNPSYPQAVIGLKVASADFPTLETMIGNESGLTCTRANSCLKIVDRNDGTTYPATTDTAELAKVAEAISGLLLNGQNAPIIFVDGTAADATNFNASFATVGTELASAGAGVVTPTYTIAAGSQGTVNTFLANHTGIVAVAPLGFLASSLAVQVGTTQDVSGVDAKWTTGDGGDIMALGHALPFPWSASKDSPYFPAGAIAARLNNQSGAPATRAVLLAASGTHFQAITGSASTRGVFKDGSSL